MNTRTWKRSIGGYTLIEVLVGILIFAIGMMALAGLQGSLARNSGDSNARTVAANIAEERIEELRRFSQVGPADPPGSIATFADIGNEQQDVQVGQLNYTVTTTVTPYYYNYAAGTFTTDNTDSSAYGDMKLVEVTVNWNDGQTFQVDGNPDTATDLGTGSFTLSDVVSSIASPSGGKVVLANMESSSYAPPVDYSPGDNPDIISIQLADNKFKESTTPLPDVIRAEELVETRFDVVTYSQNNNNATFLRREEFRAVSCECTLRIPSDADEGGFRPTVWTGAEYSQGEWVSKPFGEEANNQQSSLCSTCCRDHHDGGTGTEDDPDDPGRTRYSPFANSVAYYGGDYSASLQSDHRHYKHNQQGELVLASSDGDTYLEACRLIRKDGFWRVAQDLRQEGLNSFPADFLDDESEVGLYSDYVVEAVTAYEVLTDISGNRYPTNPYENAPPSLTLPQNAPTPLIIPGSSFGQYTPMAPYDVSEQQLRARGIYIDYLSDELREKIACLEYGGSGESCGVPQVTYPLEIIPFYDVQLTWLARWNETPINVPVDVMNQAIADDNSHERGIAKLTTGSGFTTVASAVHRSNLGLTGTDPIDLLYDSQAREYPMWIRVLDNNDKPPLSGITVAGTITSAVPGVKAADVEIEASGALCDRTLTGFECANLFGASSPWIAITNYEKQNRTLLACSLFIGLVDLPPREHAATNGKNKSKFALPTTASTLVANIVIKEDSCDS